MQACTATSECDPGLVCLDEVCSFCRADADCPAPQRCGAVEAGHCGCADADGDRHSCDDCRNDDAAIFAGAAEVCDEKDNDCDGEVDKAAAVRFFADQDHDGYGNGALFVDGCSAPVGFVPMDGDCNDVDSTSSPGRVEVCDNRDNDCDGESDEDVRTRYFRDADGDGYGDPANSLLACQLPASGFTLVTGDCDDSRADVNPAALESCNARDDDCDGTVDGQSRRCDNACGSGSETCNVGLWQSCTAPPIVTISNLLSLTGSLAEYECLVVGSAGRLSVASGMTLRTRNWLRVEATGTLELSPDAVVQTGGDFTLADQARVLANRARIGVAGTAMIGQDARIFLQTPQAPAYSGGGSAACASATAAGVGGAGGGANGGAGGQGGHCGPLLTQPRPGAGGPGAANGADGCSCPCSVPAAGGAPSGGGGGGSLAGGGGGANGGRGGRGGAGLYAGASTDGGAGGAALVGPSSVPTEGGGGGGSAGKADVSFAAEACQGTGGAGAGVLVLQAAGFVNEGAVFADGAPGENAGGFYTNSGGGGAGAGGTVFFAVDRFDNRGAISAVGGRGGGAWVNLVGARAGGGGGGGGGRVYVTAQDGGTPTLTTRGNIFVGGGLGGVGFTSESGEAGGDGWVFIRP
ncbi:MAG: putative metal-binding motif-containing protein [Myxococcales bacterium]|nr:putative metal-binding motif-containing protein [Myxococcales bacterium]